MNELLFSLLISTLPIQDTVKPQVVDTVRKMENGTYEVPPAALSKLDLWARKGRECDMALSHADKLILQIARAKGKSDSAVIQFSNEVHKLRQDVVLREKDHTKLKNDYNNLNREYFVLNEKYSTKVQQFNWLLGSLSAAAVIAISILL